MSGQRNTPRGPSQCYVWKQLFSPGSTIIKQPSFLSSTFGVKQSSTAQGQDVQSCSETAGAKPLERLRRVQTARPAGSKANSVHHEDTVYERQGEPVLRRPGPSQLGARPWLGSTQVGGRLGLLHITGVLTRTRPGTVFCKIFGNGSPKLNLRPSVWKCPIGKLETPQREQTTTDRPAPAASRKHFRRKSSGPTIASHVDVTCPPEVWGRALEAPARALLVVGRSGR